MTIANVLAGMNTILGATIIYYSYTGWMLQRRRAWGWIKLFQVVIGFIWVLISIYLFISPEDAQQAEIGRMIARPVITVTLAIIAAGSIVGSRRA